MDLSVFSGQYTKVVADAIKIGALDSKSDMLLRDLLKTLSTEMKRKEDIIQRTLGEINQVNQMHNLILSLVKTHTRVEQANIDAEADRQRLLNETPEVRAKKLEPSDANKKKAKKRITKIASTITKQNNKFVGDAS
jgi:hypothetical protein